MAVKQLNSKLSMMKSDIGVTTLPVDHHIFDYTTLDKEDLRLIVSREHRLAKYETVKLEDLAGEDFILFNKDFYLNDKIIENAKNVGFCSEYCSANFTMACYRRFSYE